VHVVDDRDAPVGELEDEDGQRVRKVVAVNDVGPELGEDGTKAGGRISVELPPAVEELVAGAVQARERETPVGEPEPQVPASGRTEADRVLEGADARLLLQEENPQRRLLIVLAGLPTAIV
jgi:hypothetical protein